MRALPVVLTLLVATGCHGTSPSPAPADAAVAGAGPADMHHVRIDLNGKWASQIKLNVTLDSGGGKTTSSTLQILTLWLGLEKSPREIVSQWELCNLPVPGFADATDDMLDSEIIVARTGSAEVLENGLRFNQPPITFVLGARLADPAMDALPTDPAVLCADPMQTNCIIPDPFSKKPGIRIAGANLTPDADIVYVDARLRFGTTILFDHIGTLEGTIGPASLEAHVLGCHLSAGGECTPADTARLEATHPRVTVTGGTIRLHAQGAYFTCPAFEADPEGGLTGFEVLDGGVTDDMKLGGASYSTDIQRDLDERGCATGGCHEAFTGPGQMHLVFKPKTAEDVLANYRAALPYTRDNQLANRVPLPPVMRARWIKWIGEGSPF